MVLGPWLGHGFVTHPPCMISGRLLPVVALNSGLFLSGCCLSFVHSVFLCSLWLSLCMFQPWGLVQWACCLVQWTWCTVLQAWWSVPSGVLLCATPQLCQTKQLKEKGHRMCRALTVECQDAPVLRPSMVNLEKRAAVHAAVVLHMHA